MFKIARRLSVETNFWFIWFVSSQEKFTPAHVLVEGTNAVASAKFIKYIYLPLPAFLTPIEYDGTKTAFFPASVHGLFVILNSGILGNNAPLLPVVNTINHIPNAPIKDHKNLLLKKLPVENLVISS